MGHQQPLRCLLALLLFASGISLALATFDGTCYSTYDLSATTCDEVEKVCTNSTCSSDNGTVSYQCFSPYSCSSSYNQLTGVGVPDNSEACNAMSVSSCYEAEYKFMDLGCSCYKCVEINGKIDEVSCTSPFTCSPRVTAKENPASTPQRTGPHMSNEEYAGLCVVYLVVAFTLASVITFRSSRRNPQVSSAKESVKQKMSPVTKCLYMALFASFVEEDGSPMGYVSYLCKMRDLLGFLDRTGRTTSRARRMRFIGVVSALLVITSLGSVFGTIVSGTDTCSFKIESCGQTCQTLCGGVNIGCDGILCKASSLCSDNSTYSCDFYGGSSPEVGCTSSVVESTGNYYLVMVVLTTAVSKANVVVTSTAKGGSPEQLILYAVTFCTSLGLLIGGVAYSTKFSSFSNEEIFQALAIILTTFVGWWYEQFFGFGVVTLQWVLCRLCYHSWYKSRLASAPNVIHPEQSGEAEVNQFPKTSDS